MELVSIKDLGDGPFWDWGPIVFVSHYGLNSGQDGFGSSIAACDELLECGGGQLAVVGGDACVQG